MTSARREPPAHGAFSLPPLTTGAPLNPDAPASRVVSILDTDHYARHAQGRLMSSDNGLLLNRGGGQPPKVDEGGSFFTPHVMLGQNIAGQQQLVAHGGASSRLVMSKDILCAMIAADAVQSAAQGANDAVNYADALIARLKAERAQQ